MKTTPPAPRMLDKRTEFKKFCVALPAWAVKQIVVRPGDDPFVPIELVNI